MKKLLLKVIQPVSLSLALVLSSLAVSHLSATEFTTPRAVFADYINSL